MILLIIVGTLPLAAVLPIKDFVEALAGNMYEDESIKNELRPSDAFGKDCPIPGVKIHITEAEKLVLSKPTKVKLTLDTETVKGTSRNVVATIEGTDLKDEVLAFSAHYDSVAYSKGSWDNATGSVTIMELMHYFKEKGSPRTLKFIWCGSEEIGLVGSRKYCEAHEEELKNVVLNINLDMIGCIMGKFIACCTTEESLTHYIKYFGLEYGMSVRAYQDVYSSDSTPFADKGIPAVSFARIAPGNTATIHNSYDTKKLIKTDNMQKDITAVTAFAERMANAVHCPVSKDIPENMKSFICAAYDLGYIKGTVVDEKLCFLPQKTITRAEAAVMLSNMLDSATPTYKPVFDDSEEVPAWAAPSLSSLCAMGVFMQTDNKIEPLSPLTRGDTAVILSNFIEIRK